MTEKRPEGPKLHPTLSGNMKGQPLFEYFRNKLPQDLNLQVYEHGLGCDGFARLISLELGGPKKARIYEHERRMPTDPNEVIRHSYVIPTDARPTDLAFNNWESELKTVEEVRKQGRDVTEDIYSTPWDKL